MLINKSDFKLFYMNQFLCYEAKASKKGSLILDKEFMVYLNFILITGTKY
jgi:hypothetical protein